MNNETDFALGAVILAAGASTRMGRPKMLLPWRGTSILGHTIQQWQALAAQTAVVCAGETHPVWSELEALEVPRDGRIVNPHPELGMFESIRSAARWNGWKERLTHWALILGDQPHVRTGTLRRLVEFAQAHSKQLCQPFQGGHRHHPVFLPKEAFLQLGETEATTLKSFLEPLRPGTALCEIDDPGIALDLDRPEDYREAQKRYEQ